MKSELIISGLEAETPFRDAGWMILAHRVENMLKHEQGVRDGGDIEALHDMRVYSRRLREALRIFEKSCGGGYGKVYRRVRDITRALGEVRNMDVFIEYFTPEAEAAGDGPQIDAARKLVAWAEKRRGKLRREMLRALDKLHVGELGRDTAALIPAPRGGEVAGEQHEQPRAVKVRRSLAFNARRLAHDRLDAVELAWKDVEKAEGARSEELHELRIAFKKLRYGLETLYPAFLPAKLDAIYSKVKDYQDVLGDIHDADVFQGIARNKLRKAEERGDCRIASGYLLLASRLVSRRHELETRFREMTASFGPREMRRDVEDAFKPIPRKKKSEATVQTGADDAAENGGVDVQNQTERRSDDTQQS